MKKIFLYAYDRINLGDDLFVHTIAKRYPHVQFYMLSNKENQRTFGKLKNLKVIDKESLFMRFIKRIRNSFVPKYINWKEKNCDAIVYIGGSIFIEYDNWEQILTWWDYEAKNRPFYVLGANFGPYKTEAYRDKLAEIFNNMEDVCFRDKYSLDRFSEVSVVRCAPDILFNCNMRMVSTEKKQIFISPINCGSRKAGLEKLEEYESQYLEFMCNLLCKYIKDGHILVFSSFCSNENDDEAIDKLLAYMNIAEENSQVRVLRYDGTNVDAVLQAIAESELIVASRFHASILGFAANKPVLPVVYSDKTIHVLEDVGFKGIYVDIRKLVEIDIKYLQKNMDKQKLHDMDILREQAERHFEKLDKLLR